MCNHNTEQVSKFKRIAAFLNCFLPLFWGGIIYILFRPDTYISSFFYGLFSVELFVSISENIVVSFLKYWFCDFLWAYSLAFCLLIVFEKSNYKFILPIIISAVFCIILETLQKLGVISGTFDWWDLLAELTAVASAVIIKRRFFYEKC